MGLSNADFSKSSPDPVRPFVTDAAGGNVDFHPGGERPPAAPSNMGDGGDDGDTGDWIPPERFAELDPEIKKILRARRDAVRRAELRNEQLLERVSRLEADVSEGRKVLNERQKSGDPQSIEDFDEGTLRGWLNRYDQIVVAAARNPENEALQQELAKLSQTNPQEVRDALYKKMLSSAVGELRGELQQGAQEVQASARLRALLSQSGVPMEALIDSNNPIYKKANALASERAQALGINQQDGAAMRSTLYGAYMEAMAEQQRVARPVGRGPLGVDGMPPARGASPSPPTSAKGGMDPEVQEVTNFLMRSGMY